MSQRIIALISLRRQEQGVWSITVFLSIPLYYCRGEWIFGYATESLVGQSAQVLRHPGDQLTLKELVETKDLSE